MGELNRGKFAPRERFAYAVVMDGGWYVGIWKDEETAKLVAAKHPKGEVRKMESCAESEIEPKFQAAGEINEGGAALWFTSPGEFPAGTQFYVQRASAAASDGGILPPVKSEKSGTQSEAHPSQPAAEGTPRTDAAVVDWDCSGEDHVNADFARTLERELAEAYTRLEANFYYNTKGERCPCKPGEIPDGIACRDETIKGQDKIIADLRDALAAAARDAERYRWLRENPHPAKGSQHTRSGYVLLQKSDLDAAIDAARAGRVS
jgi:hypothetical protein